MCGLGATLIYGPFAASTRSGLTSRFRLSAAVLAYAIATLRIYQSRPNVAELAKLGESLSIWIDDVSLC
jgi:hypothetical protein